MKFRYIVSLLFIALALGACGRGREDVTPTPVAAFATVTPSASDQTASDSEPAAEGDAAPAEGEAAEEDTAAAEDAAVEDAAAAEGDAAQAEEESPAGDAEKGQTLFATACSACHGPEGKGVPGLGKDMTTSEFIAGLSDQELLDFIKVGRAPTDPLNTTGVLMPPKGGNPALSDQDLMDIIAYIRTIHQ
jgi:mono/diheme cytochrome c family protein